ncbi:adenylyltransferase/cytidyltransferase family protein [Candidatus Nomurabacteria bacterium]|nr:adenylyltransferase/cytidyltransferase family protein [Candidatus Nomurabacteria bacterium]
MNSKKILIFGVFDGIHDGHRYFINEARTHGDQLVAVVARDSVVEKLKGKLPEETEVERIEDLLKVPEIDLVLLGDRELGTYNVLKEVRPDIIFLGYDQKALEKDLIKKIKSGELNEMKIVICTSHKPDELHSSIIKEKKKN